MSEVLVLKEVGSLLLVLILVQLELLFLALVGLHLFLSRLLHDLLVLLL